MAHETPTRLLGLPELFARYGAGRSLHAYRLAVWRDVRAGRFPPPIRIGAHRIAWLVEPVESWERGLTPVSYAPPAERGSSPEAA